MKLFGILILAIILISCNDVSKQNDQIQVQVKEDSWQIRAKTLQIHSYKKSGLLDTTYKTDYYYLNGEEGMNIKYFIIRKYDNRNNIIREVTFQISKESEVLDEKEIKYDIKNNIVEVIIKHDDIVNTIKRSKYNELNQKTEQFSIEKKLELNPDGWNLDSAVAHRNDIRPPLYDTLIRLYFYDENGNKIKEKTSSPRNKSTNMIVTEYSNKKKTKSYEIDDNGDTLTFFRYEEENNSIKEMIQSKSHPTNSITNWYSGNKLIKCIFIDSLNNHKTMDIYKYDEKGNKIESSSYE